MALVVHETVVIDGKQFPRGAVLFGDDAVEVSNSSQARKCSAVADRYFQHLKPQALPVVPAIPADPPTLKSSSQK